jgi:hypothetical protein
VAAGGAAGPTMMVRLPPTGNSGAAGLRQMLGQGEEWQPQQPHLQPQELQQSGDALAHRRSPQVASAAGAMPGGSISGVSGSGQGPSSSGNNGVGAAPVQAQQPYLHQQRQKLQPMRIDKQLPGVCAHNVADGHLRAAHKAAPVPPLPLSGLGHVAPSHQQQQAIALKTRTQAAAAAAEVARLLQGGVATSNSTPRGRGAVDVAGLAAASRGTAAVCKDAEMVDADAGDAPPTSTRRRKRLLAAGGQQACAAGAGARCGGGMAVGGGPGGAVASPRLWGRRASREGQAGGLHQHQYPQQSQRQDVPAGQLALAGASPRYHAGSTGGQRHPQVPMAAVGGGKPPKAPLLLQGACFDQAVGLMGQVLLPAPAGSLSSSGRASFAGGRAGAEAGSGSRGSVPPGRALQVGSSAGASLGPQVAAEKPAGSPRAPAPRHGDHGAGGPSCAEVSGGCCGGYGCSRDGGADGAPMHTSPPWNGAAGAAAGGSSAWCGCGCSGAAHEQRRLLQGQWHGSGSGQQPGGAGALAPQPGRLLLSAAVGAAAQR